MIRHLVLICSLLGFVALCSGQDQSLESVKQRANAGDAEAQLALARAYDKGSGVSANEVLAFKWYLAAAQQGRVEAQFEVGLCYRLGTGVEQDKEKAVEWYRKAAKQGYPAAFYNLGAAYYNGDGVAISDERSYAWFLLAQRAGEPRADEAVARAKSEHSAAWLNMAQVKLAEMLEKGDEVKAEPELAAEMYKKALTLDVSSLARQTAHYQLAGMYIDGRGVPRDVAAGREHILAAAKENAPGAVEKLAEMYESGAFGEPDYKEAARWWAECVHFGDYGCMYRLGRLYEAGNGVKQDKAEAFRLYVLASRNGFEEPKKAAEALYPQLTDKEFKTAQKKLSAVGITVKKKEEGKATK